MNFLMTINQKATTMVYDGQFFLQKFSNIYVPDSLACVTAASLDTGVTQATDSSSPKIII